MNTLIPDLMWIEGRCYRMNESATESLVNYAQDSYDGCEPKMDDSENEGTEPFEITMDNNRYKTCLHVPKAYFGTIIGKKGATRMKLEKDTRTEIKIPKPGLDDDIVIIGSSQAAVTTARRRVMMLVSCARLRQKPTHFVSIPCNNFEIINNFNAFKQQVLAECSSSSGLEESIFIAPSKLHLTVGVMTLMDNEERARATEVFQSVANGIIKSHLTGRPPLRVCLRGLSYMNDEPKRVNVLYSKPAEGESAILLQKICDELFTQLVKAGLMKNNFERESVKLHVTLINTRYRGKEQLATGNDAEDSPDVRPKYKPFDATQILEKFADYDFGVTEITSIHLSQMHSYDDEGYYMSTSVVSCS